MNPPLPCTPRQAFTLIELMVVMGVVAILAGLTLPALAKAKGKVYQIQCLNQLRQMGLATQMYWQDHEGAVFPYRDSASNFGETYWFGRLGPGSEGTRRFEPEKGYLYPYIGKGAICLCPSFPYHAENTKLKARGAAFGYGYNLALGEAADSKGLKADELPLPNRTAIFADCAQINTFQHPASPKNPMLEEFYYFNTKERTTHFRHRLSANSVFADGHAQPLKPCQGSLQSTLPGQWLGYLDAQYVDPFE